MMIQQIKCVKVTRNHLDFEGLSWTIRAISKDSHRMLDCIQIKGDKIVGCDGARIHIYTVYEGSGHEIPEGMYRVLVKNRNLVLLEAEPDIGVEYPNWKLIYEQERKVKKEISAVGIWKDSGVFTTYALILRSLPDTEGLNLDYLLDLGNGTWRVRIFTNPSGKSKDAPPIQFDRELERQEAFIMPMKLLEGPHGKEKAQEDRW